METHLTYDNKGKALGILVKQRLTTRDNLQFKVRLSSAPTDSQLIMRTDLPRSKMLIGVQGPCLLLIWLSRLRSSMLEDTPVRSRS